MCYSPLHRNTQLENSMHTEYIIVADRTSKVLKSYSGPGAWYEAVRYANEMRRAGGEVTIFKSTKA